MKKKPVKMKFLTLPLVAILIIISIWVFKFQMRMAMKQDILLSNNSCSLPCWNSIIPGSTTKDTAIDILKQISYIKSESIEEAGTNTIGGCSWDWKVSGERIQPGLGWKEETVTEIVLGLAFDLTLQEVLNEFGLPDKVATGIGGIPEHWYWIIDLFYIRTGVQIKAFTADFSSIVEPTTKIGAIVLNSPTSMETRILELYPNTGGEKNKWLHESWLGYGDLITLYDSDGK